MDRVLTPEIWIAVAEKNRDQRTAPENIKKQFPPFKAVHAYSDLMPDPGGPRLNPGSGQVGGTACGAELFLD
jgi:hypothetical protein